MIFPRCYFDEQKCRRGLECLQNYRRDFNDKLGEFRPQPVHDWASHGADAFRYLAVAIDRATPNKPLPKIQYRTSGIV